MTDSDRSAPAEAEQPAQTRDPATGSALLNAYLSQGTDLTKLVMSLSTASAAGMFALVDKAANGWPLAFWIAGVVGFGVTAWCSYHVLGLDKQLVKAVSEKFGAQSEAERSKAQAEEARLEPKVSGWSTTAKLAFLLAAVAAMAFAIASRKVETKDMTEQHVEQQGGGPQTTHQDGQDIHHRDLTGLGKVVENTTPQPTSPGQQPAEGSPAPAEAPKE
jgi:hypothetical protein